jgi:hypothetical protein
LGFQVRAKNFPAKILMIEMFINESIVEVSDTTGDAILSKSRPQKNI